MRWLVEVMSLGKTEAESLHVDAESWQKALQTARGQRGESTPLSGFSIELLDDGCRAIDPMSRLRYQVRRAPDETAGTPSTPSVRPSSAPVAPSAPVAVHAIAPASPQAPTTTVPRATAAVSRPSSHLSPAAPAAPPPAAPAPVATAVHAPRPAPSPASRRPPLSAAALSAVMGPNSAASLGDGAPRAPDPVATAAAAVPAGPPPSVPRPDVGLNVPSQVIFKREHDATDATPLTYREYVFLVPSGTTDEGAEALLRTQLELVLASLARVPAGKLVNLGVFDVAFQGKPPVPPIATLTWKDWRGTPVIEFPRRPGYVPHASVPPPSSTPSPPVQPHVAAWPPAPSAAPPAMGSAQPTAPEAIVASVSPVAPLPVVSSWLPPPILSPAPVEVASKEPGPPAVEPPAREAPPPAPAAVAVPAVAAVATAAPAAEAGAPRARPRSEDLIADLFESMHDLHFLRDAVEGGAFCLGLAMEKIPSQAGLVHLYDIDRREFLITSTRGPAAGTLLLQRHPEGDTMLSLAMGKRRAVVIADAQTDAPPLERYTTLGGAQSLIIAPVMLAGRFLGAIELLNPLDGQPFTDAEGNALTYIAEQFAEFVAARGVVTDPARIGPRPGQRP